MTTDYRALCVELTDCLEKADWPLRHRYVFRQWIDIARAALADEPAVPEGREPASVTGQPADGEVAELVAWLREQADHELGSTFDADYFSEDPATRNLNRAADLLQHLSPSQPVPVSERLQQMEDLAADAVAGLRYIEQSHGRLYGVGWDRVYKKADRLKPAHALPVPGQEVEG